MQIHNSPSGKVIKSPSGYSSFIPNDLPPKILWDDVLVNSLSRADFLLGKLAREGSKLPNPHLLIRPFITKEAVLSSKIEGTQATLSEVLAADIDVKSSNPDDLKEVQNYISALEYALKRRLELPLSLRLIKEIHEKLMDSVRGAHATPGEFRRTQNWIGTSGSTLTTAKFIPPSPDHLADCLSKLETFLHDRSLPPLIHIALCHYQFEAIHPFLDGNGRIGRLLITLLLIEREILPSPLLYLSAFFEATRDEYYRQLFGVSANASWNEWLVYFLNGVAVQSDDVLSRAERINNLISAWQLKAAKLGSDLTIEIINHLAVNPFISANHISENFKVAYTTAKRAILKLEKAEVITKHNENKRGQVYCAKQILDILEEPTKFNYSFDTNHY